MATAVVAVLLGLIAAEFLARFCFPHRGLTWVERIADHQGLDQPKAPRQKRVFVFGASSVIGYHHQGCSSLSQALLYLLQRTAPHTSWTVVNFGKAGEASDFVVDGARESLRYHPDLLIVYTGENEFIPPAVIRRHARFRLERALLHSKLMRLLKESLGQAPDPSMPDFRRYAYGSLIEEVGQQRGAIVENFRSRLQALDAQLTGETVAVYVVPVGNLLWAPSLHDEFENVVYDMRRANERAFIQGIVLERRHDFPSAARFFERTVGMAPTFADAHFRLGMCDFERRQDTAAAVQFQLALDDDLIPNRAGSEIDQVILQSAQRGHVLDIRNALMESSKKPWIGYEWVEDNCHPTLALEWTLAQSVLSVPGVQDLVKPATDGMQVRYEDYALAQHLDRLALAHIDMQIGQYHSGRPSGALWFSKALALAPKDPAIVAGWRDYQQKAESQNARQDHFLSVLLAQIKP